MFPILYFVIQLFVQWMRPETLHCAECLLDAKEQIKLQKYALQSMIESSRSSLLSLI
jgi:hypothetical protein